MQPAFNHPFIFSPPKSSSSSQLPKIMCQLHFHRKIRHFSRLFPGFTWQTPAFLSIFPVPRGVSRNVARPVAFPGLNAATLLAALAPSRLGVAARPGDATTWSELLQTAQLEVQGELLSLIEIEQAMEKWGLVVWGLMGCIYFCMLIYDLYLYLYISISSISLFLCIYIYIYK